MLDRRKKLRRKEDITCNGHADVVKTLSIARGIGITSIALIGIAFGLLLWSLDVFKSTAIDRQTQHENVVKEQLTRVENTVDKVDKLVLELQSNQSTLKSELEQHRKEGKELRQDIRDLRSLMLNIKLRGVPPDERDPDQYSYNCFPPYPDGVR